MQHLARVGIAASCLSILATIIVGALGPSAMVPALPDGPGQPTPAGVGGGGHLEIGIAAAAIILGAIGLAAALRAVTRMPPARHLLVGGCLAAAVLAFLPPSGSSDHLNYAAYGRIAALGHDPYVTVPADLSADPVVGAVEEWQRTPSVYGPVATAVQVLASHVGGESVRLTVFVLALVNAAAFIATGLLLHRITRDDPVRQRRAALLWAANPLLVYQLAAGMHLDTLAIAPMMAAMLGLVAMGQTATRRLLGGRWLGSSLGVAIGVSLGAGIAVKITTAVVALGPAWQLRRRPAKLAIVAGSALVTVLAAYWAAGPHALDQVLHASKTVSLATPWRLVKRAAQAILGPGAYHTLIQLGSLLLLAVLVFLLLRSFGLPRRGAPGPAPYGTAQYGTAPYGTAPYGTAPYGEGPMVALAFVVAWLFATPYALPWYDGLAFALLVLVPASRLDAFLVARLTVLSLAYLPARQLHQPPDLRWLVEVVRSQVVPWILLALTIGLLGHAALTARRRAGARARTRPT